MGILTSKLFTFGDPAVAAQLEACATGVPSEVATHFAEGNPNAAAVKKLQIALSHFKVALGLPAFEIDGIYSKNFGDAVERYKAIKGITNFAGRIDRIIGRKTIQRLDLDEAALNDVPPPLPVDPDHLLRLQLSGESLVIGERGDDFGADDLRFGDGFNATRRTSMKVACTATLGVPDSDLENEMRSVMMAAMLRLATGDELTSNPGVLREGMACVEHFFSAGGSPKVWDLGNAVSDAAKTNTGLTADLLGEAEIAVNRQVNLAWDAGAINDRVIAANLRSSGVLNNKGIKMGGALTAFIGGVHAYVLQLRDLRIDEPFNSFSYAFDVELIDHFGLDEDDVAASSGGAAVGASLLPFFVLQHFSAGNAFNSRLHRYRPYRTILRTRTARKEFTHLSRKKTT